MFPLESILRQKMERRPQGPWRGAPGLALLLGLGTHLLIGTLTPGSFQADDADLILFNQSLAWGYSEQGPLYSWLVWLCAAVFGLNAFSLSLLKTLILGGMSLFLFACTQRIVRDVQLAVLAAFSPILLVNFSWSALTYLTHTALLGVLSLATLLVLLHLIESGRTSCYMSLGFVAGLGILTKYNYCLFLIPLYVAGLCVAPLRSRFLDRRVLLTLGVAALLVLPHACWVWQHRDVIWRVYSIKAEVGAAGSYPQGVLLGAWRLTINMAILGLPLGLFFLLCFPQAMRRSLPQAGPGAAYQRWLECFFVGSAFLLLGLIVVTGMTHMRERWLQPLFLLLPVYLFARLQGQEVQAWSRKRYAHFLLTGIVVLTSCRIIWISFGDSWRGDSLPDMGTYAAAAQMVNYPPYQDALLVIADRGTCGNLRHQLPDRCFVCAERSAYVPPRASGMSPYLLVWDASKQLGMPRWLRRYAEDTLAISPKVFGSPQYLDILPSSGSQHARLRFGVILVGRYPTHACAR